MKQRAPGSSLPRAAALGGALALVLVLVLVLPGSSGLAYAQGAGAPLPSLDTIVEHMDDLYRSTSSHGTMTMSVKTEHYERSMTIEAWSRGEDDALMVIRKPAREAGNATLRTKAGLWNYAPRADRLIRIPSGLLSESWMGSHFTNDDLMRESSYADDFDTALERVQEGGSSLLRLRMTPKEHAAVVWTRIDFLLTDDPPAPDDTPAARSGRWMPLRADFFDGEEVLRRMHYKDVRDFGGRKMPALLEVIPTDKPGEFTKVIYEQMTFDGRVEAEMFTPRGARREAGKR